VNTEQEAEELSDDGCTGCRRLRGQIPCHYESSLWTGDAVPWSCSPLSTPVPVWSLLHSGADNNNTYNQQNVALLRTESGHEPTHGSIPWRWPLTSPRRWRQQGSPKHHYTSLHRTRLLPTFQRRSFVCPSGVHEFPGL